MTLLLWVTVGRAEIVNGKKKVDKLFEAKKIYIHKGAPNTWVLLKCTSTLWGNGPENVSYIFSMLDGSGTAILEEIVLDQPDRTNKKLHWTLELYLTVNKRNNPRFNIKIFNLGEGLYWDR